MSPICSGRAGVRQYVGKNPPWVVLALIAAALIAFRHAQARIDAARKETTKEE